MRAAWQIGMLFGAGLGLAACLTIGARAAGEGGLPAGPNRDLVFGTCQTCHSLQYLTESAGIDRDQWNSILETMVEYGMQVSPSDKAKILDYLGTYMGPHPPPAAPATAATPAEEKPIDAADMFKSQCAGCHQAEGQGVPGAFPPLAGNHDLFRDRVFPVYVLLYGLNGDIEVEGKSYNGQMPAFGFLSDAKIAALVNYVRGAWGNDKLLPSGMAAIDADTVKTARGKTMSPDAVHAYRATLK